MLFPASKQPLVGTDRRQAAREAWAASGKVLVADDEEGVRTVSKGMLEALGFEVLLAADGEEAVEVYRQHADEVVVVLLDLTMPKLSGERAFSELRRIRSDVKAILMSGYNEQETTHRFAGKGLAGFIQKPFRIATLRERIRAVLESGTDATPG